MNEGGPDRRSFLRGALVAAGAAVVGSEAEAADKKLDTLTGPERLAALKNEATLLLQSIEAMEQHLIKPAEKNVLGSDIAVVRIGSEIASHGQRIGTLSRVRK